MFEDILPYYERELASLRRLSKEFALQYPEIANRLLLHGEACDDPHVERLLEGCAFLAARVRKKLDEAYPEITDAFLDILYPHYTRPIPSMSIAQFDVSSRETKFTSKQVIPSGTVLLTQPFRGMPCKFRTGYPVEAWPLEVSDARFERPERHPFGSYAGKVHHVLRIRLRCLHELTFKSLKIDRLRFFLDGDGQTGHTLYELLFNSTQAVFLNWKVGEEDTSVQLPAGCVKPVGYEPEEGLLPYDARSFLGYRLLHEYFVFPEKFLFFDIGNLAESAAENPGREMELVFSFSETERGDRLNYLEKTVGASSFRLHCTPIVNLFQHTAEPIRLTHANPEYKIIPDIRRPQGMEVYSVDSVKKVTTKAGKDTVTQCRPMFAFKHAYDTPGREVYWHATRRFSASRDDKGTEVYIWLADRDLSSKTGIETLTVGITGSNRDLPSLLPLGGRPGELFCEEGGVVSKAMCLRKPTPVIRPFRGKESQWRLISHLSLNHLSIVDSGREAFLEILNLYNYTHSLAVRKHIQGITDIKSVPCTAYVGPSHQSAFCRGTEVSIQFDEDEYTGSGVYLLSCVLERFLGLYCATNSFTRLIVTTKQREKVLAKWPPRAGNRFLI